MEDVSPLIPEVSLVLTSLVGVKAICAPSRSKGGLFHE